MEKAHQEALQALHAHSARAQEAATAAQQQSAAAGAELRKVHIVISPVPLSAERLLLCASVQLAMRAPFHAAIMALCDRDLICRLSILSCDGEACKKTAIDRLMGSFDWRS